MQVATAWLELDTRAAEQLARQTDPNAAAVASENEKPLTVLDFLHELSLSCPDGDVGLEAAELLTALST